jgi:uncharacterized membrane protein YeaQ/YmgE (transglycosylase-associated protein family)
MRHIKQTRDPFVAARQRTWLPAARGLPNCGDSKSTQSAIDKGDSSMNLIIWLIVGGVVGWLASVLMRTDAQQGIFLNVVVGIVGAALAGFFLSPMLGIPTINQGIFSVGTFLISLLGAVILLAIVNLIRRGTAR